MSCCENEITSLGAKSIFEALSDSDTIEEIRLDDNEIGDIGGSAIVQAYGPGGEKMPAFRKFASTTMDFRMTVWMSFSKHLEKS